MSWQAVRTQYYVRLRYSHKSSAYSPPHGGLCDADLASLIMRKTYVT